PDSEFTVVSVNVTGSFVTGSYLKVKLDRNIPDKYFSYITYSNGMPYNPSPFSGSVPIINRYIFSKKINDETNIIIKYSKLPGSTSDGIVMNKNIDKNILNNISNIINNIRSLTY
ncbi:MAG: hypothetical protein IRZ03_17615, partial [Acidobacterium ailaaui]|nr:hypothetical protein [Pseudacidobacterium ailaaui]